MPTLATLVQDYHRARCAVIEADRALEQSEAAAVYLRTRMVNCARLIRDVTLTPAMRAGARASMADDRAAVLRWRRAARLLTNRLASSIADKHRARDALARALRSTRTTTHTTLPPTSPNGDPE